MMAHRQTVSIGKACELVDVSRRTLYRWIASRKVEYIRTVTGSTSVPANRARALSAQGEKRALVGNLTMPYVPVLSSRLKQASERLAGRFGGWAPEDPAPSTEPVATGVVH